MLNQSRPRADRVLAQANTGRGPLEFNEYTIESPFEDEAGNFMVPEVWPLSYMLISPARKPQLVVDGHIYLRNSAKGNGFTNHWRCFVAGCNKTVNTTGWDRVTTPIPTHTHERPREKVLNTAIKWHLVKKSKANPDAPANRLVLDAFQSLTNDKKEDCVGKRASASGLLR